MRAEGAAAAGSVVSGLLASACCIGPLVFAVLGVSGAASAHRFEPLRPYLLVVTYALLAGGFYLAYRPQPAVCEPASACERPRASGVSRVTLWIAAAIVLLATTFPWYAEYLPL